MPFADKEAQKAYKRQYYEANKAAILAKIKAYREANPEAVLARKKKWEAANPDRVNAAKRAWVERNPDHKRKYYAKPDVKAREKVKRQAYYEANKERFIEKSKAWREENPGRKRFADWAGHLRRKYGITPEQYDAMLDAQGGKCAICGRLEQDSPRGRLVVDHMHCSGKVRSLLCGQCNSGIGLLGENTDVLRRAIEYIEQHKATTH